MTTFQWCLFLPLTAMLWRSISDIISLTLREGLFSLGFFIPRFIVVWVVALFLPQNFAFDLFSNLNFMAFLAGVSLSSLRQCPSKFHLLLVTSVDTGFELLFSYNFLFMILWGNPTFIICLNCFLLKLSSYCLPCIVIPLVLQLWSSIILTRMLYCSTLLSVETFPLLSQAHAILWKAMLASLFLFLMSSLSARKEQSFFIFRHSSVSLLLLFNVITSVFVSLTWRFPDDCIFDTSRITIDLVFSSLVESHNHLHILTRLAGFNALFCNRWSLILYMFTDIILTSSHNFHK